MCLSVFSFNAIAYVGSAELVPVEPVIIGGSLLPVPVPTNFIVPTNNSSGSYYIQWNGGGGDLEMAATSAISSDQAVISRAIEPPICPGECIREYKYTLEESENGVDFQVIYTGSNKTFHVWGKESGAYVYRIKAAELQKEDYVYSEYTELHYTAVVRKYSAPTMINVPTTTVTTESIYISWSSHEKATYYTLEERVNGGAWIALAIAGNTHITTTNFTRSNPSNGRYQYRVNTCTDLACGYRWKTSSEVFVYWPRNEVQGTLWIPIIVGDITTFIPYIPSEPYSAPSNIQIEQLSLGKILSWNAIEHASRYEVQGLNAQGQWVSIVITEYSSVFMDSQFDGYSTFRVKACSYTSCSNAGHYSDTFHKRKIIFIHTDILGTPIAETDQNGDVL